MVPILFDHSDPDTFVWVNLLEEGLICLSSNPPGAPTANKITPLYWLFLIPGASLTSLLAEHLPHPHASLAFVGLVLPLPTTDILVFFCTRHAFSPSLELRQLSSLCGTFLCLFPSNPSFHWDLPPLKSYIADFCVSQKMAFLFKFNQQYLFLLYNWKLDRFSYLRNKCCLCQFPRS